MVANNLGGRWTLVGVTSFGVDCARPDFPGSDIDHWLQHSFGVLFCIVLFLTIDYSILLQDEFFFQGCTPEWISTLIGFVATRRCGRRCHRKKCKQCY